MQAEIWGKIQDHILEVFCWQVQGLLPMLAEHFELPKVVDTVYKAYIL